MAIKCSRVFPAFLLAVLVVALSSCADEHKLISIDVTPQNSTITGT
jgi:hypothetical protein